MITPQGIHHVRGSRHNTHYSICFFLRKLPGLYINERNIDHPVVMRTEPECAFPVLHNRGYKFTCEIILVPRSINESTGCILPHPCSVETQPEILLAVFCNAEWLAR